MNWRNGDYLGTIEVETEKAVCNCLERHTALFELWLVDGMNQLNQPNKPLSQPRISITPVNCSAASAAIPAASNAPMIFPARWDFLGDDSGAGVDSAGVSGTESDDGDNNLISICIPFALSWYESSPVWLNNSEKMGLSH